LIGQQIHHGRPVQGIYSKFCDGVLPALLLAAALSASPLGAAQTAKAADGKAALQEIQDAPYAPKMTVLPAGSYLMGSPATEPNRTDAESPQHTVQIDYPLAVATTDVTRAEYGAFVADTGYAPKDNDGCYSWDGKSFDKHATAGWDRPGFEQTDTDPVVCVSWNDANAYAAWLSAKTGHTYRLLSEAEWEYAARAGTKTAFFWGDKELQGVEDCSRCGTAWWGGKRTAPAGSFKPNAFGLYDMSGNVWQWVADCYQDNYAHTPANGQPSLTGDCDYRVLRGGSWFGRARYTRSANRDRDLGALRFSTDGFRVARTL
jgi:formylglycine-generating enzyme required for sulfatase activity